MRTLTLRLRAAIVLAPLLATTALLALLGDEALSAPAPAAVDAIAEAARDAIAEAARDAGSDARAEVASDVGADGAAPADATFDGRPDAPARGDALAEAGRIDAPAREGGWFPDAPRPIAPDPTPLLSDSVFVLTVTFGKGTISIDKVEREKLASKQAVVRRFGRFAAELYSGPTLLERVRFDIPLISDDDYTGDVYARGLVTSVKVRVPESDRPNKLEIWDRATERRWSFDYPPKLTP